MEPDWHLLDNRGRERLGLDLRIGQGTTRLLKSDIDLTVPSIFNPQLGPPDRAFWHGRNLRYLQGINDEQPVLQEVVFAPHVYGDIYSAERWSNHPSHAHNKWADGTVFWLPRLCQLPGSHHSGMASFR